MYLLLKLTVRNLEKQLLITFAHLKVIVFRYIIIKDAHKISYFDIASCVKQIQTYHGLH